MNTKKKKYQKKEKPKGERTSVPRPLSWNIYVKKQSEKQVAVLSRCPC
jgi:hypothetical protein